MSNQNNIFDRLRAGVSIETLRERDCEIINQLYETGNEQIVLSSETMEVQIQIEEAVPFYFRLNFGDGKPVINVFSDGAPVATEEKNLSGFAADADILLQWI